MPKQILIIGNFQITLHVKFCLTQSTICLINRISRKFPIYKSDTFCSKLAEKTNYKMNSLF